MIRLLTNRHVVIETDDGRTIDLRPPTVGEWQLIVYAYDDAEAEVTQRRSGRDTTNHTDLFGDADAPTAPYAEAFSIVVSTLGGTTIDADKLPTWTARAAVFGVLYGHWRDVKVEVEGGAGPNPWTQPDVAAPEDALPTFDLGAAAAVPAPEPEVGGLSPKTTL